MRFIPIVLIVFVLGCQGNDKPNETKLDKKRGEILKSILKGDAGADKGGLTISGPDEGSTFTLSVSGAVTPTGLPENLEKMIIIPGVKVLSYIQGINYNTINASLTESLDVMEIKYGKIMLDAGYKKIESTHQDGLLSTRWTNPENEARLFLYAFEDGKNSRIYLVFTPLL
ncbi:hypothetical protein MNBD_NITROSPINAE02-18 [hydrothermal vent metagenome]|uniref:Lipoprotein n=1 Tax=hydrothermal vent metagenome TaxID=652676 RepID=A0A3B1C5D9_9ZZZZ